MLRKLFLSGSLLVTLVAGCKQPADEPVDAVVRHSGYRDTVTGEGLPRVEKPISSMIADSLGAGGGFVVGANPHLIGNDPKNREAAVQASERSKRDPAKTEDVTPGKSADINGDGYVTVDEVVALQQANLSDTEIIDRLAATGQAFELSDFQEDYLRARRVSDTVIKAIRHTL